MSNEDGYFEIYWAARGRKIWDRTRLPSDPLKPPAGWGHGFKDVAKEAWMARASLHVTALRESHKELANAGHQDLSECDCAISRILAPDQTSEP